MTRLRHLLADLIHDIETRGKGSLDFEINFAGYGHDMLGRFKRAHGEWTGIGDESSIAAQNDQDSNQTPPTVECVPTAVYSLVQYNTLHLCLQKHLWYGSHIVPNVNYWRFPVS